MKEVENTNTHIYKIIYSPLQICIVTVLATPLAGIALIAYNYLAINAIKKLWFTVVIGGISLLIYIMITIKYLGEIPAPFHIVFSTIIIYLLGEKLQSTIYRERVAGNMPIASLGHVALVCIVFWSLFFMVFYFAN